MTQRIHRSIHTLILTAAVFVCCLFCRPVSASAYSATELQNMKEVFAYLTTEMGYNSAAACGVLANIEKESSFNPTCTYAGGASYGLCQWTNSRQTNLKSYCNKNGYDYSTIEGQMRFLQYELTDPYYAKINTYMLSVENSPTGAYRAGYYWCYNFEKPAAKETSSPARGELAKTTYWEMFGIETVKPTLTAVVNNDSGIRVTWKAVEDADHYIVYRKTRSADSWEKYKTLTGTTFTDKDVVEGKTYHYTVQAVEDGYTSEYDAIGKAQIRLTTPVLNSVINTRSGVRVTWTAAKVADKVRVYRKGSSDSDWKRMAELAADAVSWTDTTAVSGETYSYTVRFFKGESQSAFNASGLTILCLSAPALGEAVNTDAGIQIHWAKVTGAKSYKIYHKTADGWKLLYTMKNNYSSWTDKNIASGMTETYSVRAVCDDYQSSYNNTGVTQLRLSAPVLTAAENRTTGIRISWKSVDGAKHYRIYRKSGTASWKLLEEIDATACSYTDKTPVSGTKYSYTVVARTGTTRSTYDNTGKSVIYLKTPSMKSMTNSDSDLTVTWSSVPDAKGYYVYRKAAGYKEWSKKATVDASVTSWKDTSVIAGHTYTYMVRAYSGSSLSCYYMNGIKGTHLVTPALDTVYNSDDGIRFKWKACEGAEGYYIYRKLSGGSWSRVAEVSGSTLSWKDTAISNGTVYTYTVRGYSTSGGFLLRSGYDKNGLTTARVRSVKITSLKGAAGSGKLTLKWETNSKASGYTIQYSTGKSFSTVKTITVKSGSTAEQSIAGLTMGKTCYVRIRALITTGGHTYHSAWETISAEVKPLLSHSGEVAPTAPNEEDDPISTETESETSEKSVTEEETTEDASCEENESIPESEESTSDDSSDPDTP